MSLTTYLKKKDLDSMEDLLVEEIKDLYDVENRLIDALPKMADAAHNPTLKNAFTEHLHETQRQSQRLERCFERLSMKPERESCDGIKGILEEGETLIKSDGNPQVKDAALVGAAQRVEHYEMAGYGSARTLAQHLRRDDIAEILQQTLNEEGETDHKLTDLAVSVLNPPR